MNLRPLIITQAVDAHDPILGFFQRWIVEFARQCPHVTVLGQRVGEHRAPSNASVYSLGKELGLQKLAQIDHCLRLLWRHRREYDVVLVHMTPVWVVLTAPLLLLLRKPMYLWYEARGGGWSLKIALLFVRRVFSATAYGLPRSSARHMVVGHGIDTDFFHPESSKRDPGLIATIGRITRVKHLDLVLRAFAALPDSTRLVVAGGPITAQDQEELQRLHLLIDELQLWGRVSMRVMTQEEVLDLLQRASLLLHAGGGGLDKVILEAMACGCPIASTSHAASFALPAECIAGDVATFPDVAVRLFTMSPDQRTALSDALRERVTKEHSLPRLVERLCQSMSSSSSNS
jgi:glycosyltransferase involved in cell wall biosynthesis